MMGGDVVLEDFVVQANGFEGQQLRQVGLERPGSVDQGRDGTKRQGQQPARPTLWCQHGGGRVSFELGHLILSILR